MCEMRCAANKLQYLLGLLVSVAGGPFSSAQQSVFHFPEYFSSVCTDSRWDSAAEQRFLNDHWVVIMPEYMLEKSAVDFSIMFTLSYRAERGCQVEQEEKGRGGSCRFICRDES